MDAPDDDSLMKRVQKRDPEAFRLLVDRHLPTVHRYLTRLSGSRADADELSQETFLRVWTAAGSYRRGRGRFSTWLHRIAHNLHVDERRRQRNEPLLAEGESRDPGPDPEQSMALSEQDRQLQLALMNLPEAQRSALLLCQVQGLSTKQAAAVMGRGARSVESLVARARRSLRRSLFTETAEPEPQRTPTREAGGAGAAVNRHQTEPERRQHDD